MVAILAARDADRAARALRAAGETVYRLGGIERRPAGAPPVEIR
jgi:phosphoribosylaminoimidazole (AIR) synthetase